MAKRPDLQRFARGHSRVQFVVRNAQGGIIATPKFKYTNGETEEQIRGYAEQWRQSNHPESDSVEVVVLVSREK